MRMDDSLTLKAPWAEFASEVAALFDKDDEVMVDYDNDEPSITLYVDNAIKADAISALIGSQREYGFVTLRINVVPANEEVSYGDLFQTAFNGNPAFGCAADVECMGYKATYALFVPDVVQYYNDDLSEYGGIATRTYAQVARDVFGDDVKESVKISSLHGGEIII